MTDQKTYTFQSESKELLNLMIHSLYSNKEIFLRELISNASDAIDKLRFLSLQSSNIYVTNSEFKIKISTNKQKKTLTISDNGIGMNKDEIIKNLGTIAKSGTKDFIKSLKKNNIQNSQLIGKFGVGFYSSFIVSNKVTVHTLSANANIKKPIIWESFGKGEYTIKEGTKKEPGTDITLHIKEAEIKFLEDWTIRNIIEKYSDHIMIPIEIQTFNEKTKKNIWKQINTAKALWTVNKSNISEKEYIDFYKYITKDTHDPLIWTHNKVEGNQEYTNLLYIPSKAPWNLWNKDNKHGLKLYVKRIYILDDAEQFLPNYLRFVKGIIDSNDLPLNISREILQSNQLIPKIKQSITKKILNLLLLLAKDNIKKYYVFWKQFGSIIKEGPAEDPQNKELILNLLLFTSINTNNSEQTLTLKEYVNKMPKEQEKIYFITADNYESAKNSPNLEIFRNKKIDVLLLSERIDEWMMNYISEYQGKKFQSASKSDDSINKLLNISEKSEETNKLTTELEPLIKKSKKILDGKVKNVRLTYRLTNTPAIVITDAKDISTQMAKLFSAAGQPIPDVKYIFEINPNHSLIKKIAKIKDEKTLKDWIMILFEEALLIEKGSLENPNKFINRINKFLLI